MFSRGVRAEWPVHHSARRSLLCPSRGPDTSVASWSSWGASAAGDRCGSASQGGAGAHSVRHRADLCHSFGPREANCQVEEKAAEFKHFRGRQFRVGRPRRQRGSGSVEKELARRWYRRRREKVQKVQEGGEVFKKIWPDRAEENQKLRNSGERGPCSDVESRSVLVRPHPRFAGAAVGAKFEEREKQEEAKKEHLVQQRRVKFHRQQRRKQQLSGKRRERSLSSNLCLQKVWPEDVQASTAARSPLCEDSGART